jgi:signal transduction histidine kinase
VLNAVEASPPDSEVTIAADRVDGLVRIAVMDSGPGIAPGDEEKIFEPFFTTREKGSGLGLAIASNIVRQHGGHLAAQNNLGGGMTFRVELPVRREVTG